jgi:hypothetical protein
MAMRFGVRLFPATVLMHALSQLACVIRILKETGCKCW